MQSKYVVGITGGKGGVGKSNVAVNLSVSLASLGYKPLIIDADINMGNVELLLGVKSKNNISDLLNSSCKLEDVLVKDVYGVDVLPTGIGGSNSREISSENIVSIINHIEHSSTDHDVIIIDTSAGSGSSVMNILSLCSDILVVGCNEPTAIMDAYSLIKTMNLYFGRNDFLFLANMVASENNAKQAYRSLTRVSDNFLNVNIKYWGHIPNDKDVAKAVCKQKPYMVNSPKSMAAQSISVLASKVANCINRREVGSMIRETV